MQGFIPPAGAHVSPGDQWDPSASSVHSVTRGHCDSDYVCTVYRSYSTLADFDLVLAGMCLNIFISVHEMQLNAVVKVIAAKLHGSSSVIILTKHNEHFLT